MSINKRWKSSETALQASEYWNTLPTEQREKLAPLLEDYRQRGLAEAAGALSLAQGVIDTRIRQLQAAS